MKILIGVLVRNRAWILPRFLEHLSHLKYPKIELSILFLVNDCIDNSKQILQKWKDKNNIKYRYITIEDYNLGAPHAVDSCQIGKGLPRTDLYQNLSVLRNYVVDSMKPVEEALFFVDSDILVTPATLDALIKTNKDMVAALVFNDWRGGGNFTVLTNRISNIMENIEPYLYKPIRNYHIDSIFPVDLSGACMLIRKKVYASGLRYHIAKGKVKHALAGVSEDAAFCYDAKQKGFEIWCNSYLRPLHIMGKKWRGLHSNILSGPAPTQATPVKREQPAPVIRPIKEPPLSTVQIANAEFMQKFAEPEIVELKKNTGLLLEDQDYQPLKKRIFYPPTIQFGWMVQRPQQIMQVFANDGYTSIFGQSLPQKIKNKWGKSAQHIIPHFSNNLRIVSDFKPLLKAPIVTWTTWPIIYNSCIRPLLPNTDIFLWYDICDDPQVLAGGLTPPFKEAHNEMLQIANLVTASAKSLVTMAKEKRDDVVYLPNGCDTEHFVTCHDNLPKPAEMPTDGKPVIGFYGACAHWVDASWFVQMIKARPEYHFVLIGPKYSDNFAGIPKAPNFTWIHHYNAGTRRDIGVCYKDLPQYLKYFDVCVIPFKFNAITTGCSPIKFFEYLASGKPIVCTDIPEVMKHKKYIYTAHTIEDFILRLDDAVHERDMEKRAKRLQAAYKFSWEDLYKKRVKQRIDEWWERRI